MTDAIKKMLEPPPYENILGPQWYAIDRKDFERVVRGFEKLMEQRDSCIVHRASDEDTKAQIKAFRDEMDAELLKAMRGDS